jgi:hypothetical protein
MYGNDANDAPRGGLHGWSSLGDALVVDRLIRNFTREILGLVGRDDFMAKLDFECRRMNGLFLGSTSTGTYQRGPWNAPDQLGEYLLKALRIDGETRLAVRDAFMWYTDKLLHSVKLEEDFDAEALSPLIDDLRDALLGRLTHCRTQTSAR